MDLILHLGAHRTGTTALQKVLQARRRLLKLSGVQVLGPSALRSTGWALPERGTGISRAVLSDENLIGTMFGNFTSSALYPRAAVKLAELAERLPVAPREIFFAIRNYADYWVSAYSHQILIQKLPRLDAARLSASAERWGWSATLSAITRAFPEARLRVWRYGAEAGMIPGVMAEMIGIRLARRMPPPPERLNSSLSAAALAQFANVAEAERALPEGKRLSAIAALRSIPGPAIDPFGPELRQRMNEAFEAEWQDLVRGALSGVETFDPVASAP